MDESSPDNLAALERGYKRTSTVYFTMVFSSAALIIAAFFLADESRAANEKSSTPLWAAIVLTAIAAFVLRRVLSNRERLKNIKLLKGVSGLLSALQTNSIILGALAESVAVLGAIIIFLNGGEFAAFRAGGVALILFAINFPRQSVWRKILKSLENV